MIAMRYFLVIIAAVLLGLLAVLFIADWKLDGAFFITPHRRKEMCLALFANTVMLMKIHEVESPAAYTDIIDKYIDNTRMLIETLNGTQGALEFFSALQEYNSK